MVDHQDMQGKKYCTDQHEQFSLTNGKSLAWCQAEKVQTAQGKDHGDPDKRAAFFLKEDTDDRNDDDVAGGDESGFADGGVFDTELLEVACKAEQDTAADTAGDQSFAVRRCLFTGRSGLTKSPDDRQQCDRTDDISNGIEGKASNIVHADALCDKSHTPDGGGQQKQKRIPDRNRFFFHNISPRVKDTYESLRCSASSVILQIFGIRRFTA